MAMTRHQGGRYDECHRRRNQAEPLDLLRGDPVRRTSLALNTTTKGQSKGVSNLSVCVCVCVCVCCFSLGNIDNTCGFFYKRDTSGKKTHVILACIELLSWRRKKITDVCFLKRVMPPRSLLGVVRDLIFNQVLRLMGLHLPDGLTHDL